MVRKNVEGKSANAHKYSGSFPKGLNLKLKLIYESG
jgi:hypothetical protein